MSLLMDALKRAEASKQETARSLTGADSGNFTPPDFGLEPITNKPTGAGNVLPNLAQHLDSLNADLEANAPGKKASAPPLSTPAKPASTLAEEGHRAAVRNAFTVKEAKPATRTALWLTLGTLGFAAIGIAAYVWYQTQNMNRGTLAAPVSQRAPITEASSPPPATPVQPSPAAVPIFSANSASTVTNSRETVQRERTAAQPAQRMDAESLPTTESNRTQIRLIRTVPQPDVNVQRGYANLQGNSLEQARQDYEQALRNDPNNMDALLALAAIAQNLGHTADAERYRQRAFDADPRDAGAQAAALGSHNGNDPTASESRLKSLLSAQPESAPLNFALGNLFARQARWSEAQQVYFNAVAGDTDNPDYLFNLAVSLDQLRQPKLAAQHYRLALEAAANRPAAFNRERASKRLSQISP